MLVMNGYFSGLQHSSNCHLIQIKKRIEFAIITYEYTIHLENSTVHQVVKSILLSHEEYN